jgi:hypothetical protein
MNSETRPSVQTPRGISRQRKKEWGLAGMQERLVSAHSRASGNPVITAISICTGSPLSRGRRPRLRRLFLPPRREAVVEGLIVLDEVEDRLRARYKFSQKSGDGLIA